MDNAAKALIMAGGILISVMIISIAVYLLTNAREYADTMDTQATKFAAQAFNHFYLSIVQDTDGKISGLDVLNVYHRVLEDQSEGKEYPIQLSVNQGLINELEKPTGAALMKERFSYHIDRYDSDGYITHITIDT